MLRVCTKCGALLEGSDEEYKMYKFFKDDPDSEIMKNTILDLCQTCGNKYWKIEEFISDEFKSIGDKCLSHELEYFKNIPRCIYCKNRPTCPKYNQFNKKCKKKDNFELSERLLINYIWNDESELTERHPLLKSFYKEYANSKGYEVITK